VLNRSQEPASNADALRIEMTGIKQKPTVKEKGRDNTWMT
jgi:hypothetical protein